LGQSELLLFPLDDQAVLAPPPRAPGLSSRELGDAQSLEAFGQNKPIMSKYFMKSGVMEMETEKTQVGQAYRLSEFLWKR